MAYGLTLDQVRHINQPQAASFSWGGVTSLTELPQFSMYRVDLLPGAAQPLHILAAGKFHAFVESGEVLLRSIDQAGNPQAGIVRAGQLLPIPAFFPHAAASHSGAAIYLFGPRTPEGLRSIRLETDEAAAAAFRSLDSASIPLIGQPTTDVREKYWGRIETILSEDVADKRIFVQKGGQSSLEYHVEKSESYYIHSGLLKVGLRIGRAENRSIVMMAGQSYDVRPGVMHMRIGLEDTVILEVSTRDSDSDSYLVEDGQTYRHIDVDSLPLNPKQEQPA
ncbi:MAG: cupin domain-containing protein [Acidobacteriaceae bacterium]